MAKGISSAIACDAEAEGRSALDGDLVRLKTGAPGGWPSAQARPVGVMAGTARREGRRQLPASLMLTRIITLLAV